MLECLPILIVENEIKFMLVGILCNALRISLILQNLNKGVCGSPKSRIFLLLKAEVN
jgi:hypothetical protein